MSPRRYVSSGSPYEPILGISRAVRIGDFVDPDWLVEIEVDAVVEPQRDTARVAAGSKRRRS